MVTMTCKQLGGACDKEFHADTFEDISQQSRKHGEEMLNKGDKPHLDAMQKMQELMKDPKKMEAWMDEKRAQFEKLL